MSKSTYAENQVLDWSVNASALSAITPRLALFTVAPTDAGGGTEVTGGSYARVAIDGNFGAASGGSTSNTSQISFPTATANWGTVVAFGVYDAASGGNLIRWANLTTSRTINSGATPIFAVGQLTFTET